MTEYWVSQGNKWCDTCKIYISNNPASIRNHELGQKHKDAVAKRLNTMREDKAAKEKELKQAARVLEQIETKAKRSYQKDLETFQESKDQNQESGDGWDYDSSSGYHYNKDTNCYYDSNSGFYYTDSLGKWVTKEEAFTAASKVVSSGSIQKNPPPSSLNKVGSTSGSAPPPGRVVSTPLNPMRSVKGGAAKSSIAVTKRKRIEDKPKAVSKEESDALKAREAAKKRVADREKPLLGLYKH